MLIPFKKYKESLHFSVNFFSVFLLVTFIPDILHINNLLIKNAFWVIKLLLALWVIYKIRDSLFRFSLLEFSFFIVSFIYLTNLYVDIFIDPLPFLNRSEGIMDFIGFCLGILIALSFRYDPDFHSEKSFLFFWVSLTIGLILAYFFAIENLKLDHSNVRYDANSTVNTINYGIAGCTLSLISVYGLVNYKSNTYKLLFLLTFAIGLISIGKAGSRSPVVVLALISAFYFVARLGFIKGVLIIGACIGLTILSLEIIIELLESMGSTLATRLTNMIVEGETSGRDSIYSNVFSIIERSPVFGSYYLVPSGKGAGLYPHNFILEVFMTTGLVGGVPFMILLCISIFKSYKLLKIRHPSSWIAMIFLQIIGYGMFSTGLYTSQDFWAMLFFMLSLNICTVKSQQRNAPVYSKVARRSLVLSE